MSTKKKIDAFKSRWAEALSFGDFFVGESSASFEEFTAQLDPKIEYFFLIPLRGKNRMFQDAEQERIVYLVQTVYDGKLCSFLTQEERDSMAGSWAWLPIVEDPVNFSVENYPNSIGLCHVDDASPNVVHRFLTNEFIRARDLRANTPCILMRYGQLWKSKSPLLEEFEIVYEVYLYNFKQNIRELENTYYQRYTMNQFVKTNPFNHAILKQLKIQQAQKRWEVISTNNILNLIFSSFSTKLYKMM